MTKKKFNKQKIQRTLKKLRTKIAHAWFDHQQIFFMLLFIGACSFAVWQWYIYYYSIGQGGAYYEDVVVSQQGIDLNEKKYDEVIERIGEREKKFDEYIEVGKDVFYE